MCGQLIFLKKRSRARQQYTNALPTGTGMIFRYDFPPDYSIDEPSSPRSEPWVANPGECSSTSSPAGSLPPPAVDRGLKPGRKTSDSVSNESSPLQPNIDLDRLRILKPPASSQSRVKDECAYLLLLFLIKASQTFELTYVQSLFTVLLASGQCLLVTDDTDHYQTVSFVRPIRKENLRTAM